VEHATQYAARREWTVIPEHVYIDDGISGADFERPGFLRLMNALKPRPTFDVLIMADTARLGRKMTETRDALQQIVNTGVRVCFYLNDEEPS
jgi:DNA invertase Pin-like site-specific DNA recombinase